ncbi:hypothetical protein AYJ54_17410 [Bradyrhizobium centrolobii]|uniref:Uncharacterized protein n=1 Tax=Bradyrhizobium centrolobii TaxID=1505087 RepID=A0A176YN48_9BRAD|nr:hypothetical protein AYJ54_17410 [Bradyrhizobium centrolobii]
MIVLVELTYVKGATAIWFGSKLKKCTWKFPFPDDATTSGAAHHQGHRAKQTAHPARFMGILQRFRPGTYWAPLQQKLEKMAKGT